NLKQKKKVLSKLVQLKQELEPIDDEIYKNKDILLKLNFIEPVEENMKVMDALYSKYHYLCQVKNKLMAVADSLETEHKVVNVTQNLAAVEHFYLTILELTHTRDK